MDETPPLSSDPPELPRVAQLIGGLVLVFPIFFTFTTDNTIFGLTALLTGFAVFIWTLRRYPIVRSWWFFGWCLFGVWLVLDTALVSRQQYYSIIQLVWWALDLLILALALSWSRAKNFILNLAWLIIAAGTFTAAAAIFMLFLHPERATGFLSNANGLGSYLLWGVFICLTALSVVRRKWIIATCGLIIVMAWFLTVSITAFAAAVVPLVIWTWWNRHRVPWRRLLLSLGILVVIFAIFVVAVTARTHQSFMTRAHGTSSWNQRLEFQRSALKMWEQKPWFGWGLGTYKKTLPRFTIQFAEQPLYTHNLYLQMLAETGIIGASLFLILVVGTGWMGWRVVRRQTDSIRRRWLSGLWLGWLAFTIHAGIDFGWFWPAGQLLWFVVSGIFLADGAREIVFRRGWIITAPAVIVAVGLITVSGASLFVVNNRFNAQIAKDDNDVVKVNYLLRPAIQLMHSPDDVLLYTQGLWLRRQGNDLSEAEQYLRASLRSNPDEYFLWNQLGLVFLAEKKRPEARDALAEAYRLDPKFHPDFAINYARALVLTGDKPKAQQIIKASIALYASGRGNIIIDQWQEQLREVSVEVSS